MTSKQQAELERIRHYVGTLDDFKSFWDQQAGSDTNANSTPDRQGYGGVHPTRDGVSSPHWREKEKDMKHITEAQKYDVIAALKDIKKYNRSAQTSEDFEDMALSIVKNLGFKPTGNNVDNVMDHLGAAAGGDDIPEDADLVKELYPMLEGVDTDLGHTDDGAEMEKKPNTSLPTFETFVAEGFEGKDFDEVKDSADRTRIIFNDMITTLKKDSALDQDNVDLILARLYKTIEGYLDNGSNKRYWRKY